MNWKSFDWKYLLTFAVAVAAIVIPFVWQQVQDSRSMSVRLLATATLQPLIISNHQDLQVLLDGQKLDDPYLSLFELTNDGNKPVTSADFDSPIELLSGQAAIRSAQINGSLPPDITTKISVADGKATIAPFLSNPSDSIFFTVITAGGEPAFDVRARISGIKHVPVIDTSVPESHQLRAALSLAMSFFMAVMYFVMMKGVVRGVTPYKPLGYLVSAGLAFGCSFALAATQKDIGEFLPTPLISIIAIAVMMTAASFVSRLVLRAAGVKL
ncbi:hypothetical protein NHF39_03835 [Pseudomonas proteolytica]|nr:hypothetical protein [Pseudomonas proteolytica]USW95853.1 hypothetical protein NHF39_03835 [Pseudomonas proteolytica]USX00047.1 hypothetical protein NHF41_27465 [Pseudomonas proteolytica]